MERAEAMETAARCADGPDEGVIAGPCSLERIFALNGLVGQPQAHGQGHGVSAQRDGEVGGASFGAVDDGWCFGGEAVQAVPREGGIEGGAQDNE